MKLSLVFSTLLLTILSACSGQTTGEMNSLSTPSALPFLASVTPTHTTTATPTPAATRTAAATATSAPTANVTETPVPSETPTLGPLPTEAQFPTPGCPTVFIPTGFSKDGSHLVGLFTVNEMKGTRLQVLDLRTFVARTLVKNDENIAVAALSPDGELLAWALPDFQVQLIRLGDGKIIASLSGHTNVVNALRFSPDGSRLYSASSDQSVIVWDVKNHTQQAAFQPTFYPDNHPSDLQGLGISPDGKTLVTIPFDGSTRTWDTTTYKLVSEYQGSISGGYSGAHASYTPDGKFLVIGLSSGPGDTILWRVEDHTNLWSGGMMSSFDISPDGRLFAYVQPDENNRDQIIVSSVNGQTVYQTIPPMSDGRLFKLIFAPDSNTLVFIDSSGILRFWNINDGRLVKTYAAPCP